MESGVAKIGMRVAHNALAKRTHGIGYCYKCRPSRLGDHFDICGTITATEMENEFGSQLVRVAWDDGCADTMSPCWLKQVKHQRGVYRHGKRSEDLQNSEKS